MVPFLNNLYRSADSNIIIIPLETTERDPRPNLNHPGELFYNCNVKVIGQMKLYSDVFIKHQRNHEISYDPDANMIYPYNRMNMFTKKGIIIRRTVPGYSCIPCPEALYEMMMGPDEEAVRMAFAILKARPDFTSRVIVLPNLQKGSP